MSGQRKMDGLAKTESPAPAADPRPRGRFALWVAALALVIAALFHESLFEGKGLVPADGLADFPPWVTGTNAPSNRLLYDQFTTFIPQHEFAHREFLHGRFPLWNPNVACGVPNLAAMLGALLFPINVLLLPVDPFYAAGIAAFLKLFLAGWFTMLYLRLLGASNAAAFLAGLVFSLSGFMIVWLGHPHVNAAMWLPVLLFLVERSFRHPAVFDQAARRLWVGFAAAAACLLLSGHAPTMVEVALVVGSYFLFRLADPATEHRALRLVVAGAAWMPAFLLAAPQLLPFLEYYHNGSLATASHSFGGRVPLNGLLLYLLPYLNGSPVAGYEGMMLQLGIGHLLPNFNERTGYVGVLPLFFGLYALAGRRCRWTWFYVGVAAVSLLAVFGVPPVPQILLALPAVRDITLFRMVLVTGFAVAVLAGIGWDKFFADENRRRKFRMAAGFGIVIAAAVGWIWYHAGFHWERLGPDQRGFLFVQLMMLAGSLVAGVGLVIGQLRPSLRVAIGLGWIATDLVKFGMGYNPSIPHDRYYPATPAIEWLRQRPGDFRILGINLAMVPNTAEVVGLKDVRGYDIVSVRRYEELITGTAGDLFFYQTAMSPPPSFSLLNAKYVLAFHPMRSAPVPLDLVYSNEIFIYQYRDFRERAMAVFDHRVQDSANVLAAVRAGDFDPAKTVLFEDPPPTTISPGDGTTNASVRIVSDAPDDIEIKASMSRPGFLLLLDTWFPGWVATVNGVEKPVLRADYNFRAVELPAGDSVVRFSYRPRSFRIGMDCFFAGLSVLSVLFFFPKRRKGF